MTAAETVGGIEWYIIEYEKEGVPPLESLKANLELFKKLRELSGSLFFVRPLSSFGRVEEHDDFGMTS